MAIVNKINIKKSKVKSRADFADVFIERILDESFGYDEVRVAFDRYVKKSLKTNKNQQNKRLLYYLPSNG